MEYNATSAMTSQAAQVPGTIILAITPRDLIKSLKLETHQPTLTPVKYSTQPAL